VTDPYIVREATAADVDAIYDLDAPITGLTPSRGRVIVDTGIAAQSCLVCIDRFGGVLGFVVFSPEAFFGRDFVHLLEVSNSHRRLGVATALLADALARCTTETIFTSTNESNVAMRSLLARDSWQFSGSLTGRDHDDPELVFWKQPVVRTP
jgi:ribosomal protein S18 acetylase RimI-like enzyme